MPTSKELIQNLVGPVDLNAFCALWGLVGIDEFPRPSEADGKSPDELASLLCSVGFEFDRKATHSNLYRHKLFPSVVVGIATTPGDKRGGRNLLADARRQYTEALQGLRDAMALAAGLASVGLRIQLPGGACDAIAEGLSNFLEDTPRTEPDRELPSLAVVRERWSLDAIAEKEDVFKTVLCEKKAEYDRKVESQREALPDKVLNLLKTATEYGAQKALGALRKIEKEFGYGHKKMLEKVGVPDDVSRDVADMLLDSDTPLFPEPHAQRLEDELAKLRYEKKGKKKPKSDRQPVVAATALGQLEQKLKKLPTMDITKLINDNIAALERRHEEREALLREALREQTNRAIDAENALAPLQNKVAELAKVAELEAERADGLADELDKARAAAADNSAVQKLISDLHVAVDGFRVKHAQADLEKVEEILLAFQVEEGVEV